MKTSPGQSEFAHWGETKESMREKAIDLFSRLLKEAREKRRFPQDGSKGQAEAYHRTLINSLLPDSKEKPE